jgi:hypothetical protein
MAPMYEKMESSHQILVVKRCGTASRRVSPNERVVGKRCSKINYRPAMGTIV